MSDGTWYESSLTCITLYYRHFYTEMYVRWNLVRKPYNIYYFVLQALLHGDVCQMELGAKAFNMYYLVLQAMLHGDVCQMELGTKAL